HLLAHGHALIGLCLPIEILEHHIAEGADGGQLRRVDLLRAGKGLKAGQHLFTRFQHHDVGALAIAFVQKLMLHGSTSARQSSLCNPHRGAWFPALPANQRAVRLSTAISSASLRLCSAALPLTMACSTQWAI